MKKIFCTAVVLWVISSNAVLAGEPGNKGKTMSPTNAVPKLFPDHARIVFQGDSITHGGRGGDPNHIIGHSYVILIAAPQAAYYPDVAFQFFNRGVSGNTINAMYGRWKVDTLNLKPDVVSILIGVNDLFGTVGKGQPFDVNNYEKTYRKILDDTRKANPKVRFILMEPFIMPGKHTSGKWEVWQKGLVEMQRVVVKLAKDYQAPVVHLQKIFNDAAATHPPVDYWIWDGIHPTFPGHQLIADEWIRVYMEFYGPSTSTAATQQQK